MASVKITAYQSLDEVKHEDLRSEAQEWQKGSNITCGTAIIKPDDGSGPMEGFFDSDQMQGMIVWGDDMSDWIPADDLTSMFRTYTRNF